MSLYIVTPDKELVRSNVPSDLRYVASHEWVRVEDDGSVTVGITDHAQESLGDVVFVELPEVGTTLALGADAGVVESVKAASDIYAPLSGQVMAINETLAEEPELVNSDAYDTGWFFKMRLSDAEELAGLLSAEEYIAACDEE